MALLFEWDEQKAGQNLENHGVALEEDATVFGDPLSLTIDDPLHSTDEERFVIIGAATGPRPRVLVVVHTERGDRIRIISAREATPRERRSYEHGAGEPGSG